MPTYDYQCRSCGVVTEVIHPMREDGPSVCELCGGSLRRVLFPAGIIFKGSGFYRNDSRKAESTESSVTSAPDPKTTAQTSGATADSSSGGASAEGGKTKPSTSESSAS